MTTYDYTAAGDLETVNYSDSTPDVTYSYNRLGQRTTAAWSTNSLAYSFNDAGQLLSEAQSGLLGSLSVSNAYDAYLHRTGLSIQNGQSPAPYSVSYGFDTGGRLSNVTQGGYSGSYGYLTNSPLVGTLTFKTNTTTRLTTTRAFDALNRLQSVTSSPAGSGAPALAVISAYDYNAANLRTRMTLADGSYWIYTYDRLGQVVSGKRYWQDGTPVAGQQFEYGFDDIGNRKTAATGGDASGTGLRVASYGANLLNQYTNRTVPGTVDILGVANPTAAVTANGNTAYRKGDYFWQALTVGNSNAAQYPLVTTISQYGAKATNTGNVYLPQTPEAFTYDSDGNLTQEGRWDYTWDGENRLIAMQTRSAVLASGVPEQRLEFAYDPQSRRISKTVSNKVSGAWSRIVAQRFLYDGWNLLAILNPQSSIVQSFAWGLDLSGSLQGAGGVGGLLWVSDATTINGQPSAHGACYDGNGNVAALVNFADGSLSARYEYGPFGEAVRQTGAMAEANPFCFSTKFTDNESGHLYYGYRYYLPSLGRWASRDPLGERGGVNVYSFLSANPIARIDRLGLDFWNGGEISGEYDEVISRGSQQLGTRVTRTWSRALTRIYAHVDTGCPCTRSYYVADYAQYLDYVDTDYYTWEIHKNVDLAESEMWGTIAELCGEMYEAGDWPCAAVAVLCAAMSGATRDLPANTSYYRVDTVLTSRSWRRGNEWVAISPGRLSSKEVISSRRCETTTTYHPFTGLEMPYFETVAAEGVYVHSRTVTPLVNMNGDTVWSICRGFSVN